MAAAAIDLLLTQARLATMAPGAAPYGAIERAALAIAGERIAWVGPEAELPDEARRRAQRVLALDGRWITPGLIDCHTHLVYAGDRSEEFERRLNGLSYEDISRAGGGIRATVRATRAASEDELVAQAASRLAPLLAEGVTTIEIKSGYGLEAETEARMLRAARRLGLQAPVSVQTTLLAAHTVPEEFAGRADDYIDHVITAILPATAALADAVDAFSERIAFTRAQTARVFAAARSAGLPVKLHADQLSDCGGAALAASFAALSADHLEYASAEGVAAMARAGTIAVLLPGAFYMLRESHTPPVDAFRRAGVPIALATDCNPGTSPVTSLLLMLNMGCILFRLTPEEALAGVTRHAARALGLPDRGVLASGMRADCALWNIIRPVELCHRLGANPSAGVIRSGALVRFDPSLCPH